MYFTLYKNGKLIWIKYFHIHEEFLGFCPIK